MIHLFNREEKKPEPKKSMGLGDVLVGFLGELCKSLNRRDGFEKATRHLSEERKSQLWDVARNIDEDEEFQAFLQKAVMISS